MPLNIMPPISKKPYIKLIAPAEGSLFLSISIHAVHTTKYIKKLEITPKIKALPNNGDTPAKTAPNIKSEPENECLLNRLSIIFIAKVASIKSKKYNVGQN